MERREDPQWGPPSGRRFLLIGSAVFVSYAVVGVLTLMVGQFAGLASPLWPAAGLAFASVYVWGWRMAPSVFVGSAAANLITLMRQDSLTVSSLVAAIGIGIGAALFAGVGASLVARRLGRHASLSRAGQIVAFLAFAGPVAAIISASFGTGAQIFTGLLTIDQAPVSWLTWWSGDSIGVVVFAPLFLMLVRDQRDVWVGRRIRVAVPVLVGTALFIGVFAQASVQATAARELRLEQLAATASSALQRNVASHQEVLEGIGVFFEASQEVDASEFTVFTKDALRRYPNLQAVSWNPLVPEAELAAFEVSQRERQGIADYRVTERDEAGDLIPVTARDEYVPVGFIEPLATNRPALGFDINSNPVRKQAIDRVRTLGVPAATAPIDLVQETGTQKGMLALVPVYASAESGDGQAGDQSALRGFAVGVYRLGDLLSDTFTEPAWDSVDIALMDVSTSDDVELVAQQDAKAAPSEDLTTGATSWTVSEPFTVYGRTWQLEVRPTSGPLASPDRQLSATIEFGGLVVLFLLQSFVLLVTGLERSARRQAERARQEASTDELTGLFNRRAFLRNLERVRERSRTAESSDVLLFLDLDGFKAVNDEGGHEAGDQLLCAVARTMVEHVRSRDTVARIGGDEFAIILNNCELDRGSVIAEGLVSRIRSQSVETEVGPMSVGVSIGVAGINPTDAFDVDDLMRLADDACYVAKRQGGGVSLADASEGAPR